MEAGRHPNFHVMVHNERRRARRQERTEMRIGRRGNQDDKLGALRRYIREVGPGKRQQTKLSTQVSVQVS